MPFEFDIVETNHLVDQVADDRGLRDTSWHPLTDPMNEHSRAGWELVDVRVTVTTGQNKYGRAQRVRNVVSVWKRPIRTASNAGPNAGASSEGGAVEGDHDGS